MTHRLRRAVAVLWLALGVVASHGAPARAEAPLPEITQPVTDLAKVIDAPSAAAIDTLSRRLQAATGDVVVVVTVPSIEGYGDIREYAVKLFENHGRGIGQKGQDNGILIVLALKERRAWIEVGYGLEAWITDGFSGETTRDLMVPEFRNERYGVGLLNGMGRIVGRIAQARQVTLTGVEVPRESRPRPGLRIPLWAIIVFFIVIVLLGRMGGGPGGGMRTWGGGPWSGWSSGVGPFGGGWSGGGMGGGFGGGFGGFGGGRSGGGGGGGSW